MAYLDLNSAYVDVVRSEAATPAPSATAKGQFSALEWTTIALARRDSVASLGEPGRIARALGGLFGIGAKSRLADPRLEALRRIAVHAWHRGYALPVSEIKAFNAAGFSNDQLEALLASVTGARLTNRRRAFA